MLAHQNRHLTTMKSSISHKIKHRKIANDEFYTPDLLAKKLITLVPFNNNDLILSAAYGTGNFYKHFPVNRVYTTDFFNWHTPVDWIIDNPPYSMLDKWLDHSALVSQKGFAYLLGLHNLTPKRIEHLEAKGFYIKQIFLCKVFKWYGISAFIVWEKHSTGIINYDRIVWR